jgi:hypothetical protein
MRRALSGLDDDSQDFLVAVHGEALRRFYRRGLTYPEARDALTAYAKVVEAAGEECYLDHTSLEHLFRGGE